MRNGPFVICFHCPVNRDPKIDSREPVREPRHGHRCHRRNVSRKDFQDFCREHPEVALKVIAVVGTRLRRLIGIIEELSFTTVRQRLIALILQLAESGGVPSEDGVRVELTKSHQDFAAELGTVRELISRNLSRLQAEGFLEVDGRSLVVKDIAGLKRELAPHD
jgi:CRP-like cAMP-binding protein